MKSMTKYFAVALSIMILSTGSAHATKGLLKPTGYANPSGDAGSRLGMLLDNRSQAARAMPRNSIFYLIGAGVVAGLGAGYYVFFAKKEEDKKPNSEQNQ